MQHKARTRASEMLLMMHINFIKYDLKSNPINKKFKTSTFKRSIQLKSNEIV